MADERAGPTLDASQSKRIRSETGVVRNPWEPDRKRG